MTEMEIIFDSEEEARAPTKKPAAKKRGRPPGSKNKAKVPAKRGRPAKASTKKPTKKSTSKTTTKKTATKRKFKGSNGKGGHSESHKTAISAALKRYHKNKKKISSTKSAVDSNYKNASKLRTQMRKAAKAGDKKLLASLKRKYSKAVKESHAAALVYFKARDAAYAAKKRGRKKTKSGKSSSKSSAKKKTTKR